MIAHHTLVVDGIAVPIGVLGEALTQTYQDVEGGAAVLRMGDGTALVQSRWRRCMTTIAAAGVLPVQLAAVNWRAPVVLGCVGPRGVAAAGLTAALPAARRADTRVFAVAVRPDGELRPTAVTVAGDTATVTEQAGALGYIVYYYPQLTVVSARGARERYDTIAGAASWEIELEEV